MELEGSDTFHDHALIQKREILGLNIKYCLHKKGCGWTSEVRHDKIHDKGCQYAVDVRVNGCDQLSMRNDMDEQVTNQRVISCAYCNLKLERVVQDHYKECDKYPLDCIYKCGMMVQRCQMEYHIGMQGTCPKSLLDCEFKDSGCPFRGRRGDLHKHIADNVVLHLSLIANTLRETREKSADTIFQLNRELKIAKDELKVTRDELEKTTSKLTETTVQLSEEIHRSLYFSLEIPKTFLFTWTIANWHEKMKPSKGKDGLEKINSSRFYVYPGYHLYMVAYPNGNHPEYRECLSIFLYAGKGDFDKTVRWPFPFSFDIDLVDQQVGGMNICRKLSPPCRDALMSSTCSKGCGYRNFASHQQLKSRCYIRDDTICISLSVHVKNEEAQD
ncbi:TNF receptor-associated factor 4-like [Corticium candelabrum]|uniref:TNF receptor-associated factor 4-like n=1 Tax=Corticium candelabrum TaxID=121492 RepID=UPI002E27440C|nr:TNF receptor-associated factor 4-like [Corticium candelabrum]